MLRNAVKSFIRKVDSIHWLIILSFAIWMIGMRDFLLLKLPLCDDAFPYYEHIRFYVESLMRGVLPLWDPVNMFCNGVPNDFFLRRIGPYNPFLLVIVFFKALGIPFQYAYTLYLAFYYWLGTIGFYMIAQLVLKDRVAAFAAYLLLLFSSLGTRLFDSYIVLLFVPIVWFFYFLLKFSDERPTERISFLGMIFTLMMVVTTYLPFYFLTIFLAFILSFVVVYPDKILAEAGKYFEFFKRNKIFVLGCGVMLALALVPAAVFYVLSKQGNIVMPHRSANAAGGDVIQVSQQWIMWWGIVEEMIFSGYFLRDLGQMQYAVIFVSFFAAVILIFGIFAKINRKLCLLGLWTLILFLIGTPRSSVYKFLFEHGGYFKYFRNLHFLLWIGILPVFIFFLAEQFRLMRLWEIKMRWQKTVAVIVLLAVHAGLIAFFQWWGEPLWSFYAMVMLSVLFWSAQWLGFLKRQLQRKESWIYLLLLAVIVVQPVEVFFRLSLRKPVNPPGISDYERPYLQFSYTRAKKQGSDSFGNEVVTPPVIFYATPWLNNLVRNINFDAYDHYAQYRFVLYDLVLPVDENSINFRRVEDALRSLDNTAFVPASDAPDEKGKKLKPAADPVLNDSEQFRVVSYSMNDIKFKTNFPQAKFLVFNDSFHPSWKAFLNNRPVKIYRANLAFQGFWLPAGENVVVFRYGKAWNYALEISLLLLCYGIFMCLVVFWVRR